MTLIIAQCGKCEQTRKCKEVKKGFLWNRKVVETVCIWCEFNEKLEMTEARREAVPCFI